jgi:O-antigen/teichoic acid export membrane protein
MGAPISEPSSTPNLKTPQGDRLKAAGAKGVAWLGASQLTKQILTLLIGIVLMRLLEVADFGAVAIAFAFIQFAAPLRELGFGAAIVQRADLDDRHLASVFWLNVWTGIGLALLTFALAKYLALYFKVPVLRPILWWFAADFIIGSLAVTQTAILTRTLRFKELALREMASIIVGGGVGIGMAFSGFGVWALVGQLLAGSAAGVVLLWSVSQWRPSFTFSRDRLGEMTSFGLNVVGFEMVNYLSRNVDKLLIGKVLGDKQLGYYSAAYRFVLFPLTNVAAVVSRVAFPVFSRSQDDLDRLRTAYLSVTQAVALVCFPILLLAAVMAPEIVPLVVGPKWNPSVPVLQLLSIAGLRQVICAFNGAVYRARGRADLQFRLSLLAAAVTVTGFVVGLHWGIIGVAAAYMISGWLITPLLVGVVLSLIELSWRRFLRQMAAICAASLAMAAVGEASRFVVGTVLEAGDLITAAVTCGAMLAAFASVALTWARQAVDDTLDLVKKVRRSPG